jgi:hypothetical protein
MGARGEKGVFGMVGDARLERAAFGSGDKLGRFPAFSCFLLFPNHFNQFPSRHLPAFSLKIVYLPLFTWK